MLEPAPTPAATALRATFLDNLRTLMVLLVVVLHVADAYSKHTSWWYVDDANAAPFDVLLVVSDIFAMPVLFFIAGYFALPSLAHQQCAWRFTLRKLRRLGLPLLIGVFFVTPLPPYIKAYLNQGDSPTTTYWSHCVAYFQDGLAFTTGIVTSTQQFNLGHFWFISLLLLFFLVLAGWRSLRGTANAGQSSGSRRFSIKIISLVVVLSVLGTLLTHGLFSTPQNPEPWVVIGNVLQFQPTRLTLYVLYFLLGLHAWSRDWFGDGWELGSARLWTLMLIMLLAVQLMLGDLAQTVDIRGIGVAYLVNRCLLCLAFLFFFLSVGLRCWNTPTKVSTLLAANSYNIYLVHFPVVIGLQALLFVLLPHTLIYLKFVAVTATTIVASYATSQWLLRPHPRWFVGGLLGVYLVAALLDAA